MHLPKRSRPRPEQRKKATKKHGQTLEMPLHARQSASVNELVPWKEQFRAD